MKVWVVNAFADGIGKGGPAGVVIYDSFPADRQMLDIASQLGFSNSAFVVKTATDQYQIRWFTPLSEAPLCGHATFATLEVLRRQGQFDNQSISLHFNGGVLYASNISGKYTISFPRLDVAPIKFTDEFLEVVGHYPRYSGTDGTCLLLDFAEFSRLTALAPNLEKLCKLPFRAIIATSCGPDGFDFASRYFAPKVGINEDPVCVSAHARLVPYWHSILAKTTFKAFQASQRTASLECEIAAERVLISGSCYLVGTYNIKELDNSRIIV